MISFDRGVWEAFCEKYPTGSRSRRICALIRQDLGDTTMDERILSKLIPVLLANKLDAELTDLEFRRVKEIAIAARFI